MKHAQAPGNTNSSAASLATKFKELDRLGAIVEKATGVVRVLACMDWVLCNDSTFRFLEDFTERSGREYRQAGKWEEFKTLTLPSVSDYVWDKRDDVLKELRRAQRHVGGRMQSSFPRDWRIR